MTDRTVSGLTPAFRLLGVACIAAGLAGCNATGFTASAGTGALRPGASTLSIVDVYAPDPAISQRFGEAFAREARARGFTVVPANAGQSATQVKAYLDAYPVEGNRTAYSYVIQTSPDGHSRGERVNGATTASTPIANAWTAMDDNAMRQVASRSLDDLTRVLSGAASGTPQEE